MQPIASVPTIPTPGEEIWQCGGMSRNVIASPLFANGILYVGSSYDTRAMIAIRVEGASGDITTSETCALGAQQADAVCAIAAAV